MRVTYGDIHRSNLVTYEGRYNRGRLLSRKQRDQFDRAHASAVRSLARYGIPGPRQYERFHLKRKLMRDVMGDVGGSFIEMLGPLLWPIIAPFLKQLVEKLVEILMEKIDELGGQFSAGDLDASLHGWAREAPKF